MGFLDWFKREKKVTDYSPDELRREEGRLQIRESQMIAKLDKLEAAKDAIFRQGFEVRAPVRRRILARKFEEKTKEIGRLELDLGRLSKEAMTVSALRYRLVRRSRGESGILKKIGGAEIEQLRELFESDSVTEEMYAEKLTEVLGVLDEEGGDRLEGMGEGARSVLDVWGRMDDGVIGTVEEGLEEARGRMDEEGLAESEGE